ncbi:MAG: hypothetical protein ABR880_14825 [Candidatus Sulfotelmatobacter sp.]|jgi:hypothetical protein
MRFKIIALILALTVMSWAQTATPSAPSTPQQSTVPAEAKACPCCGKASAETKEGQACCAHHAAAAKDAKEPACCAGKDKAACCSAKDAKSCKRNSSDQTTAACCGGEKCVKDCEKGCCASHKKDDKTAMNYCSDKRCGKHCAARASVEPQASLEPYMFGSTGK